MPTQKKSPAKKPSTRKASATTGTLSDLPDLRTLESMWRGITGQSEDNALNKAQELVYRAWESRDTKNALALAQRAIKASPLCADAYMILADLGASSAADARKLYELALKAGELALGPNGFEEFAGHFWGFLETRPYMRARAGLAQLLWDEGHHEEAIKHYQDMLKLNPNDNQGIRYLLATCLLHTKDDAALMRLLKQQKDDGSCYMIYTRALMAYRTGGDTKEARKLAEESWHSNVHVPAALAVTKKVKGARDGYYSMGGEDEAAYYLEEYGFAWKETPGAISWLVEVTRTLKPRDRTSRSLQ